MTPRKTNEDKVLTAEQKIRLRHLLAQAPESLYPAICRHYMQYAQRDEYRNKPTELTPNELEILRSQSEDYAHEAVRLLVERLDPVPNTTQALSDTLDAIVLEYLQIMKSRAMTKEDELLYSPMTLFFHRQCAELEKHVLYGPEQMHEAHVEATQKLTNRDAMSAHSVKWVGQFGMPDAAFIEKLLLPKPSTQAQEKAAAQLQEQWPRIGELWRRSATPSLVPSDKKEAANGLKGKFESIAVVMQQLIQKKVNRGANDTGSYPSYGQFYKRLAQVKKELPSALKEAMPEMTDDQAALVVKAYDCWRERIKMSTGVNGPNR